MTARIEGLGVERGSRRLICTGHSSEPHRDEAKGKKNGPVSGGLTRVILLPVGWWAPLGQLSGTRAITQHRRPVSVVTLSGRTLSICRIRLVARGRRHHELGTYGTYSSRYSRYRGSGTRCLLNNTELTPITSYSQ